MYLFTMAALFFVAYADIVKDVIEGETSVRDLAPNNRIEVLNKLVELQRADLVVELVPRSRFSRKYKETVAAMKASRGVLHHGLFRLITDYALGPQINVLDLDAIYAGKTLLIRAVSKQKRGGNPRVMVWFPLGTHSRRAVHRSKASKKKSRPVCFVSE